MRVVWRNSSLGLLLIFSSLWMASNTHAQSKSSWDAAIDSLAGKIAATVGTRSAAVHLGVKNLSSLDARRVTDFRAGLEGALQKRGMKLIGEDGADALVDVTLAENLRAIVFAAEVRRGVKRDDARAGANGNSGGGTGDSSREVAIVSLDRDDAMAQGETRDRLKLERETLWSQRERILDFLIVPAAGEIPKRLFVLEARRLVVYRAAADGWQVAESHPLLDAPGQRNPRGFLQIGNGDAAGTIAVHVLGQRCSGSLAGAVELNCGFDASPVVNLERDFAAMGKECGAGELGLVSGAGDWTEADVLRVVDGDRASADSMGEELAFAGPILALRAGAEERTARVIWRDLATGEYEGSIVTVGCGD